MKGARQLAARYYQVCALGAADVTCTRGTGGAVATHVGGDVAQLAVGAEHVCVRRTSGAVACWGDNQLGQLGTGVIDHQPHAAPEPVRGIANAIDLVAGDRTTCAVLRGGRVACWGYNEHGETGDGTTGLQAEPGAPVASP